MATPQRRKKVIGRRRRVEDEGEEDAGIEQLDDDSLSDGSFGSDDIDAGDDSDTSNVDDGSTAGLHDDKKHGRKTHASGKKRSSQGQPVRKDSKTDQQPVVNGLDSSTPVDGLQGSEGGAVDQTTPHANAPIIVSSAAAPGSRDQSVTRDKPRREHDEYRRKRDEDPAFVPNRGAFFMHDHRHAGPSANGFRPFGRGGRGRGRGGIGGPFAPMR